MTTTTATYDTQRALLAAIVANPDDDNVRLVFADWLQENGDEVRGEFVRVQVELARLPPKPRELCVLDGAGQRLEGLGVALTPRGDGHYSASYAEHGLSIETFAPNERVDVYAHFARKDRIGWMRGLKYVKHVESRQEIIFRKDAESGPWVGVPLAARERELLAAHEARWRVVKCEACGGSGETMWPSEDGGSPVLRCPHCVKGDAGGLLREWTISERHDAGLLKGAERYACTVEFRRGWPDRVSVPTLTPDCVMEVCLNCGVNRPGARAYNICSKCGVTIGTRTVPSAWLASVLTATPERGLVAEVVPLDREPFPDRSLTLGTANTFDWCSGSIGEEFEAAVIPAPIFALMKAERPRNITPASNGQEAIENLTPAAAIGLLARAVAAFGRQ